MIAAQSIALNDRVQVYCYGKRQGKVITVHDFGDGYEADIEVELDEIWRGCKRLWFPATGVDRLMTYSVSIYRGPQCMGVTCMNMTSPEAAAALVQGEYPDWTIDTVQEGW